MTTPTLDLPAPAHDWQQNAGCRNAQHPELWFPEAGHDTRPARRICRHCPVTADCLAYALARETAADQVHGVWGGLTASERGQLRRCLTHTCHHTNPAHCARPPWRTA